MKIVFEGVDYQLEELSGLRKYYAEAGILIHFIEDWQNDQSNFQFRTSGSTGTPKVINVSRNQITASVDATTEYLRLEKSHQVLLCLDPSFVASLMMTARCLINDMDLILTRPVANPLKSLEHQINFASFVPLQIYKMIEEGTIDQLAKIKNILIGGAPLSRSAFEVLALIDTNIFLTYGMTETVSHIALMPVKGKFTQAHYEVLPVINIKQDMEQCLNIFGVVTNDKWLQTNDIVELLSNNKFRWLGRKDHVINSGGIKIHPEQLEKSISSYISTDFIISWRPNEHLGSECLIITEDYQIKDAQLTQIQQIIAKEFSKYHIPKSTLTIDAFERTLSGKVNREETRKKALGLSQSA